VYANGYYGPDHKNNPFQMEFTWITGSISWFNTVVAGEWLGVFADYNGLRVDPRIPKEWEGFTYFRHYRGADYDISVKRDKNAPSGHFQMSVDGKPADDGRVPDYKDGKTHKVEIIFND
jgi:cellobiose phosphorylase